MPRRGLVDRLLPPIPQHVVELHRGDRVEATSNQLDGVQRAGADLLLFRRTGRNQLLAVDEVALVVESELQSSINAEAGGYSRQFIAILGRASARDVQVLTFYWK